MARRKAKDPKAEPSGDRSLGGRLGVGGARFSLGLTAAILLLGLLLPGLLGDQVGRRFEVDPARLQFDLEPVWLEAPARDEVEQALAGLGPVSLRDDEAIEAWLEDLEACSPWVRGATSARKVYPDRLVLDLDLRRPIARLQTDAGRLLLDDHGVILGSEELTPSSVEYERPLVLYRRGRVPPPESGSALSETALRAGLEVIKELNPHLARLRRSGCDVLIVDVSPLALGRADRRTDVQLFTSDGRFIEWGRARSLRADEPTAETKVQHLLSLLENQPPFEDVCGYCVQFHSRRHVSMVRSTGQHQLVAAGRIADPYGLAPPGEPGEEPPTR